MSHGFKGNGRKGKHFAIYCKQCGNKVVMGARDGSGKRHGHCTFCHLEWHIVDNKLYSHLYA
jgi:formate dehydrogenase maturation protein FdhE